MEVFSLQKFAGILIVLGLVAYFYLKHIFDYWKRKNVPYGTTSNFIGFLSNLNQFYAHFKSKGHRYFGLYLLGKPVLVINDLELIRNVLLKDFQYFHDHGSYHNVKGEPLTENLFSLSGTKWKKMRVKLTPTFTSGKIKMMFPIAVANGKQLVEYMDGISAKNECVDIKNITRNFLTDVIGSCAFGVECNSFSEEETEFQKHGKAIFAATPGKILKQIIFFLFPILSRKLGILLLDKNLTDFFSEGIKKTIEYREKNNVTRKDFLQLLIDMKNNKETNKKTDEFENVNITTEEISKQSFLFFVAGLETSSSIVTFALYHLATNQDIQEKIRNEINDVLSRHENITYEAVMEMKYMTEVVNETLRMYPSIPLLPRKCTRDYKIPDSDTIIEKGTFVIIPAFQIHYDPEYYEDPHEFRPERFTQKNRNERKMYTYLPFGEGPRICVAMRFALIQIKIALTIFLSRYRFTLSPKTIEPLGLLSTSPHTGILCSRNTVYLDVHLLTTEENEKVVG